MKQFVITDRSLTYLFDIIFMALSSSTFVSYGARKAATAHEKTANRLRVSVATVHVNNSRPKLLAETAVTQVKDGL